MLVSRGRTLLFADADGATRFSDISKLESALNKLDTSNSDGMAIVCGSRAHLEKDSIAQVTTHHSFMHTFFFYSFFNHCYIQTPLLM